MSGSSDSAPVWVPLESNPEVLNEYLKKLGVTLDKYSVHDVYGLDPDILSMVPKPVIALILLFPLTENYEAYRREEEAKLTGTSCPPGLYHMKQTVHNACGTVALIHSVANNLDKLQIAEGSPLHSFLEETKSMTPEERAKALANSNSVANAHQECASEGQSQVPPADEAVTPHFISFVLQAGKLYELDGRKALPVCHGASSEESLLTDAAAVCRGFMKRDPNEVRFTILALAGAQ